MKLINVESNSPKNNTYASDRLTECLLIPPPASGLGDVCDGVVSSGCFSCASAGGSASSNCFSAGSCFSCGRMPARKLTRCNKRCLLKAVGTKDARMSGVSSCVADKMGVIRLRCNFPPAMMYYAIPSAAANSGNATKRSIPCWF